MNLRNHVVNSSQSLTIPKKKRKKSVETQFFIFTLTFEKVFYSFPDGGNKASSKIWDLIAFDQPEEILKTKIQVSHLYKFESMFFSFMLNC